MTVLAAKQPVTLSFGVLEQFVSPAVVINALTDAIMVRLRRPTTLNPMAWTAADKIGVAIVVMLDGVEYRCSGRASGGIRLNRNGNEITHYVLHWRLPYGHFDRGASRRLGELSRIAFRAHVVLTRVAGNAITEIEVTSSESPAPLALS